MLYTKSVWMMMFALFTILPVSRLDAAKSAPIREAGRRIGRVFSRRGGSETADAAARQAVNTAARRAAVEQASPGMRTAAARLIQRHGDDGARIIRQFGDEGVQVLTRHGDRVVRIMRMHGDDGVRLISRYGEDAVTVMTRQRGMGVDLLRKLGPDAVPLANAVPEREMVRLMRHMDDVAALAPSQRASTLRAMQRAPGSVADFLEAHPVVLKTGAGVTLGVGGLVVVNERVKQGQTDTREVLTETRDQWFPERVDPETGEIIPWGPVMARNAAWFFGLLFCGLAVITQFFVTKRMKIKYGIRHSGRRRKRRHQAELPENETREAIS